MPRGEPTTAPADQGQRVPAELLTTSGPKHRLYLEEAFFREAWDDVEETWGEAASDLLRTVTLLVLKPDAVVGRRGERTLGFVGDHGFAAVAVAPIRIDRHVARAVWRYEWNLATTERMAVVSALYEQTDAVLVVLRDLRPSAAPPASVRLAGLKGSSIPARRGPGQLRDVLGGDNCLLTFVHTPDEPIDVVRELGIFFDRAPRRELLAEVRRAVVDGTVADAAVAAELARQHGRHAPHDLSPPAALARLEAAVADAPPAARGEFSGLLAGCRAGRPLAWRHLVDAVEAAGLDVDRWDLVVLGTEFVAHNLEGVEGILVRPDDMAGWVREETERAPGR